MNNRVCLHPDIKWHGEPDIFRADIFKVVGFEKIDGVAAVTVRVEPKRMSGKRLVKLMMAHGMGARNARSFAEMCTRDGWPHFATYKFVVEKMHEFIDMKNTANEPQEDETPEEQTE